MPRDVSPTKTIAPTVIVHLSCSCIRLEVGSFDIRFLGCCNDVDLKNHQQLHYEAGYSSLWYLCQEFNWVLQRAWPPSIGGCLIVAVDLKNAAPQMGGGLQFPKMLISIFILWVSIVRSAETIEIRLTSCCCTFAISSFWSIPVRKDSASHASHHDVNNVIVPWKQKAKAEGSLDVILSKTLKKSDFFVSDRFFLINLYGFQDILKWPHNSAA